METLPLDCRDAHDVLGLAELLAAVYDFAAPRHWSTEVQLLTGGGASSSLYPRAVPAPPWGWIDTPDQLLVAVAGVMTPRDGLRVFSSTTSSPQQQGSWSALPMAILTARTMLAVVNGRRSPGPRNWLLVGHSYGGVIATVLAALVADSGAPRQIQVCTFGAPRPGGSDLAEYAQAWTVRRYMASGDAVPLFPPRPTEAPLTYLAGGPTVALAWPKYVHPAGGVVIRPDGTMAGAQTTSLIPATADGQLAGWLLGEAAVGATPHSLASYIGSLEVAAASAGSLKQSVVPATSTPESVVTVAPKALGGPAPPATPTPLANGAQHVSNYVPPNYRATVVKTAQHQYSVMWISNIIATGPERSKCRTLAKHINSLTRRFPSMQSIDHTAFNQALADYWVACADPSLGFNPPANIV